MQFSIIEKKLQNPRFGSKMTFRALRERREPQIEKYDHMVFETF